MKILAIETSSERCVAALLEDTEVLGQRLFANQASFLMLEIQTLFEELKAPVDSMECIVVGQGPGSYTGMRLGAMAAKTFSFAKQIPLVGIPSLLTFIPEVKDLAMGPFAVVVDAKIGGLYLLLGDRAERGESVITQESAVYPLDAAIEMLKGVKTLYTPHQMLVQKRFTAHAPPVDMHAWHWHEHAPNPVAMARFALERLTEGKFSQTGELELLYLRKTQAEIEKEQEAP